jgi:hypothetical protein
VREERTQYQELLKLKREAEQLGRIHLVFKFFEAEVSLSFMFSKFLILLSLYLNAYNYLSY